MTKSVKGLKWINNGISNKRVSIDQLDAYIKDEAAFVFSVNNNQIYKILIPKYAIRFSTRNFGFENNIKSIPLYAVFCIK